MFDDIRPYSNEEIPEVLKRTADVQEFQQAIAAFMMPRLHRFLPSLAKLITKHSLKKASKKLATVEQIQLEVYKYLNKLVKQSSAGFSYAGEQYLTTGQPALFISNHRDIVLDVALVNLALHYAGSKTVEAAVGDNLLDKQWVADLMRLNKSFVVKRSAENKREMLKQSKHLSAYIHHALTSKQENVWIAQKEGRAKDGLDKTNPALISMLLLNKPKSQSIADYLKVLNIIPVSISYEYDPCDRQKAKELSERANTGSYQKSENEDFDSIVQGMSGNKGKVHLNFCKPIQGEFADSKAIAQAIDKEIINNYQLFDSNYAAHQGLDSQQASQTLEERMQGLSDLEKSHFLTMYANPVAAKLAFETIEND